MKRALASRSAADVRAAAEGSAVDAVEPRSGSCCKATPTMPATVIAERIGWTRDDDPQGTGARSCGRPTCRRIRSRGRCIQPGELAQCDLWFPPVRRPARLRPVRGRPPVLVMVSGYSRVITARMLPSRQTGDLIDGHWRCSPTAGARSPRCWSGTTRPGSAGRPAKLTAEFAAFARPARDQGAPLPPPRSGGEGPGRAGQRLPGDQSSCPAAPSPVPTTSTPS